MKTLTRTIALVLLCTPLGYAQDKPSPAAADKAAAEKAAAEEKQKAPDPRRPIFGSVRFDIVITDTAAGKPIVKTVSLNVSTGGSGSIRTTGMIPAAEPANPIPNAPGPGFAVVKPPTPVPLNVDVKGVGATANGFIRAQIVVEYQPYVENVPRLPSLVTASSITEFPNGVKTMILQAADPMSDRRTTIEVTATILK